MKSTLYFLKRIFALVCLLCSLLTWEKVPGVEWYRLDVSPRADFAWMDESAYVIGGTYSIPHLSPSTKYYWRVAVFVSDNTPLVWSTPSTFTTEEMKITLLSPANNSTNVLLDQTFRWSANVSNNYTLEVASDEAFTSIVSTSYPNVDSATVTGLDNSTTYFWRVTGQFWGVETFTGTSATSKFTTIEKGVFLISPADEAVDVAIPTTLSWTTIPEAEDYLVEFSLAPDFSSIYASTVATGGQVSVPLLLPSTTFYWRVSGQVPGSEPVQSTIRSFATEELKVTLISPLDNSSISGTDQTFKWTSNISNSYTLEVAYDDDFTSLAAISYPSEDSATVMGLQYSTMYYWRVTGHFGNFSGVSDVYSFSTIDSDLVLISPVDGAVDVAMPFTLAWEKVSGVEFYRVDVSSRPDFAWTDMSGIFSGEQVTVPYLAPNTTYYWHVAVDVPGSPPVWSATSSFTTEELKVTLLSPANNSTNIALDQTFRWTANVSNNYTLEVAYDETFTSLASITYPTVDSATVPGLHNSTTYFWRVTGHYFGTEWLDGISAVNKFTTADTTTNNTVTLVSPVDEAVDVEIPVSLSWTTVPISSIYRLEVSLTEDFQSAYVVMDVSGGQVSLHVIKPNTKFYWRVSPIVPNQPMNWSDVSVFTTENLEVTLLSPADNSDDVSSAPTFRWNANVSYINVLEVATDETFQSIVGYKVTSGDSAKVENLAYGTMHYWRVTSAFESIIATSAVNTFTVLSPIPTLVTPENHAVDLPPTFVMNWTGVDGATGYVVDISSDPAFTGSTPLTLPSPSTVLVMAGLEAGEKYYWRVGVDRDGTRYWSDVFDFTTATVAGVHDETSQWNISPNPAKTQVMFQLPDGPHEISVLNSVGQPVWTNSGTSAETLWEWSNHAAPSDGMYVVTLRHGGKVKAMKLLIAK